MSDKLSELLSAYFCGKCGYLGSDGPDHPGCGYSAFRDRRYHMAVELETALEDVTKAWLLVFDELEQRKVLLPLWCGELTEHAERITREALAKVKP